MTPVENNHKKKKKSLFDIALSDTLLLAVIPIIAYVFTSVYQAGYLKAFELPLQFVSINAVDVFNIGGKVLLIFVLVVGIINFLSSFLPKGKIPYPMARRISQFLPLFLLILPSLLFHEWGGETTLLFCLLLVVILIMFIPPLLTRKHAGNYMQRMEALDNESSNENPWEGSLFNRTADLIGQKAFIIIVYFLLAINLVYNAGKAEALNQKIFHVTNTSPETVVLFMSTDRLVCAPFDRDSKIVEPVFSVVKIGENSSLTLKLSEIGHLRLNTTPIYPTTTPSPISTATPILTSTLLPKLTQIP